MDQSLLSDYLNIFIFSGSDVATIENYFYDFEILVVLSRDKDGNRYLRVQETISAKADVVLDVLFPEKIKSLNTVRLNQIGKAQVKFTVLKPTSLSDDEYDLIAYL